MKSFIKNLVYLLLILLLSSCSSSGTGSSYQNDHVENSFVVMGDLQIGAAQTKQENPSSTNIPQFEQNVVDIAALPHQPDYSFILG